MLDTTSPDFYIRTASGPSKVHDGALALAMSDSEAREWARVIRRTVTEPLPLPGWALAVSSMRGYCPT